MGFSVMFRLIPYRYMHDVVIPECFVRMTLGDVSATTDHFIDVRVISRGVSCRCVPVRVEIALRVRPEVVELGP